MVGVVFTVTLLTAVLAPMQPKALVPVTEYDVFTNGLTTFEPDEYVYVDAPLGAIVKLLPVQITPELTVMVGVILTVIVLITKALTQPNTLVPVIE